MKQGMRRALNWSLQARTLHSRHYSPFTYKTSKDKSYNLATTGEEFQVINPANGDCLCTVSCASTDEVRETIEHAHVLASSKSHNHVWARAPAHVRSKVLSSLARALELEIPRMAQIESLQTGRAIREMNAQLGRLPEWLDYYAALLKTNEAYIAPTHGKLLNYVQRVPLGVVAQITPFNHPLLIAIKKIAPALAAGNSVIVKPSELAPISVLEFARLAVDAGVPPGVLSVLPGPGPTTGKEIVSNPLIKKVDITAGTETGRAIGGIVGSNLAAYTAELGGKAPIVVFNDADLTSAVNGAAFACFVASGQTCVSGTRLLVQEGIYDDFMSQFLIKVEKITDRMGNPLNPQCSMGSVISDRHLKRIEAMVRRRKNGNVLIGGERMVGLSPVDGFDFSRGNFFAPTVIDNITVEDETWKEEVFGPVVVVKRFTTEEEGVALANASKYGLGAGIWTSDLSRAHRVAADIESGLVWVNTHHRNGPSSPWGGMKESGIGRENGVEALMAYSQSKSTIVNIASVEEMWESDDWFSEEAGTKRYG